MRRTMIPVLVLATAALSTGVVLPRLQPLREGSDPVPEQPSDPHRPLTECEVLRKLYHSKSNWMDDEHLKTWKTRGYDTDNNQDDYNEYFNKRQSDSDEGSLVDSWLSYPSQFGRPAGSIRDIYPPETYADETPVYGRVVSVPTKKMLYLQNSDVLIQDDAAYYVIDKYMAATNPFDYPHDRYNCLYKTMSQLPPASTDATPTDNLEMQEERVKLDTNEINPLTEQVTDKRYDDSVEKGEKEIPDELVFNDGERGDVQKKLFSFWSRLQALSHKGRQLPTRRHNFVYYGPDDTRDGPLTAETRASHLRPPGQPLRWG